MFLQEIFIEIVLCVSLTLSVKCFQHDADKFQCAFRITDSDFTADVCKRSFFFDGLLAHIEDKTIAASFKDLFFRR